MVTKSVMPHAASSSRMAGAPTECSVTVIAAASWHDDLVAPSGCISPMTGTGASRRTRGYSGVADRAHSCHNLHQGGHSSRCALYPQGGSNLVTVPVGAGGKEERQHGDPS